MNELALTVTSATSGNNGITGGTAAANGYWQDGYWVPLYEPYVQPYITPSVSYWYSYPVEPQNCIGKAHVFECDHVEKCKCGAITRKMKRAK